MDKPIVGIHLDLKYQMPKKSYLLEWVRRLPEFGINTLLLEYEDKFPYRKYPFLRDRDAFTPKELKAFLQAARGAGLQVIPLVQSLSHLEFALAHPELAALREMPDIPTQICPSNPRAVQFVRDLYDEVLAWHAEDPIFNIGGDEAWGLGTCPKCAPRIAKGGKAALWLEHTKVILDYVRKRGKRPFVWDDAFWAKPELAKDFPKDAILGHWNYAVTKREKCGSVVACVSEYRKRGIEFVMIPCGNWGVLFPRRHCLENAATLIQAGKEFGAQGVINTMWSCFHLPLPVFNMDVAATGAAARGEAITPAWERAFIEREFGAKVEGAAEALTVMGELWEVPIAGLKRPVTPLLHGCMDMVMHYPGGQEERAKRGAYPLDWTELDLPGMYRRKLTLLRAMPDKSALYSRLDELLRSYPDAAATLQRLAKSATTRRSEARLLAALANLKCQSARALSCLLRHDADRAAVRRAWTAARKPLEKALSDYLEPASVRRFIGMWWEPVEFSLRHDAKETA